jgi:hypothetical protein
VIEYFKNTNVTREAPFTLATALCKLVGASLEDIDLSEQSIPKMAMIVQNIAYMELYLPNLFESFFPQISLVDFKALTPLLQNTKQRINNQIESEMKAHLQELIVNDVYAHDFAPNHQEEDIEQFEEVQRFFTETIFSLLNTCLVSQFIAHLVQVLAECFDKLMVGMVFKQQDSSLGSSLKNKSIKNVFKKSVD